MTFLSTQQHCLKGHPAPTKVRLLSRKICSDCRRSGLALSRNCCLTIGSLPLPHECIFQRNISSMVFVKRLGLWTFETSDSSLSRRARSIGIQHEDFLPLRRCHSRPDRLLALQSPLRSRSGLGGLWRFVGIGRQRRFVISTPVLSMSSVWSPLRRGCFA